MKKLVLFLALFSLNTFAGQLDPQAKHINQILSFELYKQYKVSIEKVAKTYNKKIQSKSFHQSLKKIPLLKMNKSKFKLSKAYIKNNKLILGNSGLKLTFKSFLNDSFFYRGKRISLSCHSRELCLREFTNHLGKKVSFNFIISEAFASFDKLTNSDYNVLAALVSFDESFENISSWFNPLSSDEERRLQKIQNLEKLKEKIAQEASSCESWQEGYDDYGKEHSFTIPGSYSSMYSLAKRILELEKDKESKKVVTNKLGKSVHTYTGITVSSDLFGTFGNKVNSKWSESLKCEKLPSILTFLKDPVQNKKNKYCADTTCRDIKLPEVTQAAKDYCKSMESLKQCLQKFYSVAKSDFNDDSRMGADENEKESFEELFELDENLSIQSGKVISE